MQIGISIANHRDLMAKSSIRDTARMTAELGFDSVWILLPIFRQTIETLATAVVPNIR